MDVHFLDFKQWVMTMVAVLLDKIVEVEPDEILQTDLKSPDLVAVEH